MISMSVKPSHVAASVLLVIGGFVVAVAGLAIALASILADAGTTIRPTDAALLGDLVAILPFVFAFAGLNMLAAAGTQAGKSWARTVSMSVAAVAVTIGATGLVLVVAGGDPSQLASQGKLEGMTILAAFTLLYLAVITALTVARLPQRVLRIGAPGRTATAA
jgi:uncharacterized membrane protein